MLIYLYILITRAGLSKINKQVNTALHIPNPPFLCLFLLLSDNPSIHSNCLALSDSSPSFTSFISPFPPASFYSFSIFSYSHKSNCQNCLIHILKCSRGTKYLLGTNVCERKKVGIRIEQKERSNCTQTKYTLGQPNMAKPLYPSTLTHHRVLTRKDLTLDKVVLGAKANSKDADSWRIYRPSLHIAHPPQKDLRNISLCQSRQCIPSCRVNFILTGSDS